MFRVTFSCYICWLQVYNRYLASFFPCFTSFFFFFFNWSRIAGMDFSISFVDRIGSWPRPSFYRMCGAIIIWWTILAATCQKWCLFGQDYRFAYWGVLFVWLLWRSPFCRLVSQSSHGLLSPLWSSVGRSTLMLSRSILLRPMELARWFVTLL